MAKMSLFHRYIADVILCAAGGGPERPAAGPTDHVSSAQIHQQFTITAANVATLGETRCVRRSSLRRAPLSHSWILDPKRILFIFATL